MSNDQRVNGEPLKGGERWNIRKAGKLSKLVIADDDGDDDDDDDGGGGGGGDDVEMVLALAI